MVTQGPVAGDGEKLTFAHEHFDKAILESARHRREGRAESSSSRSTD